MPSVSKHYEIKYRGEGRKEKLRNPDGPASLGDSLVGLQVLLKFLCRLTLDVILFLTLSLSSWASNSLTN